MLVRIILIKVTIDINKKIPTMSGWDFRWKI